MSGCFFLKLGVAVVVVVLLLVVVVWMDGEGQAAVYFVLFSLIH